MKQVGSWVRSWAGVLVTIGGVLWMLFGGVRDGQEAKACVTKLEEKMVGIQINDAKQDKALEAIAEMKDDIGRLTDYVLAGGSHGRR